MLTMFLSPVAVVSFCASLCEGCSASDERQVEMLYPLDEFEQCYGVGVQVQIGGS